MFCLTAASLLTFINVPDDVKVTFIFLIIFWLDGTIFFLSFFKNFCYIFL